MANLRIDCGQFEQAVQARLDARLSLQSDPLLVQHALDCAACRECLDEFVELEAGLAAWAAPSPQALLETGAGMPAGLSHGRFGGWSLVASMAAVLLICLLISFEPVTESAVDLRTEQPPAGAPLQSPELARSATRLSPHPTAALPPATVPSRPLSGSESLSFTPVRPGMSGWSGALAGLTPPPALFQPSSVRNVSYRLSESLIRSPLYRLPAQLPGVRPLESSLRLTVDLLEQTFQETPPSEMPVEPDLGMFPLVNTGSA